jgi:hypothetical protein
LRNGNCTVFGYDLKMNLKDPANTHHHTVFFIKYLRHKQVVNFPNQALLISSDIEYLSFQTNSFLKTVS